MAAALAVSLLVVILYAAFSHGAISLASGARVEMTIAALAVGAGLAGVWAGALRFSRDRMVHVALGLLATFAAWSALSVLWSFTPDASWAELNRYFVYVLVLALAVSLGASLARAGEFVADGFLLVAILVMTYALGQKVLPALHVPGVFDLNQTGQIPRLQEPLGYWNALALLIALAVPLALSVAADPVRSMRARLMTVVCAQLMLLTIGLTYSRGAVVALVAGLVVWLAFSRAALRCLIWLGLALAMASPALVVGLGLHWLSAANVPLGRRQAGGLILLGVLIVSGSALVALGRSVIAKEPRGSLTEHERRRVIRWLSGAGIGALLVLIAAVSLSGRGLTGTISHQWHNFTAARVAGNYDPGRLLSANSENRWVWWNEALGAFSDKPLAGWGAGSFGSVHLLYRTNALSVNNPHSVPLQFLAETGLVGAMLAISGIVLLLRVGARRVRGLLPGTERLIGAGLLGGFVAFCAHCLYDWDWDIPAVTLPALLFVGVLAGSGKSRSRPGRPRTERSHNGDIHRAQRLAGLGARAGVLGLMALAGCLYALSVALPSLAANQASHAQVEASGSLAAASHADATATLASELDPLSSAGLDVRATIAIRRGELEQARGLALEATDRQPSDATAWVELLQADLALGDRPGARQIALRILELDPMGYGSRRTAGSIGTVLNLNRTPPTGSATSVATPSG